MAFTPARSHHHSQSRTPQSRQRLQYLAAKSPNPNSAIKDLSPAEHPVEVIGRIRDFPDRKEKPTSTLQINPDRQTVRVRADFGYRDFSLDGISLSEEEDLEGFYKKFVESRIHGVKMGSKCTIMMYGPTGSGKSHTMFGCPKLPGIVYRSLKDILGEGGEKSADCLVGTFVQVTVLEIYNEEIYDLLSNNGNAGFGLNWSKGSASKVRLEVMGKKAKNATFISGNEAGKISKEIQKVEKRRIVKSTLCNERSSRSHCMIILDVPTVGGRLMLVDMAGSENIEQAGQVGFEAKMQTAKINQGNIALKRVVESIANGDSHVPFRDSKLTMLLQDSFEDDKSKILMILCASPDPKEIHKTISTLEYGAKAKCIVRGPHTPTKDKFASEDTSVILGSRLAAMDQFIYKLQMENKQREREWNEAQKQLSKKEELLSKKEEEVAQLRAKIEIIEDKGAGVVSEEEINLKVNERTQLLKCELERKLKECQRMANEFVELGKKRMEEKILQQQQEVEMLRQRLEEIESEIKHPRDGSVVGNGPRRSVDGSSFAKRLLEMYADDDSAMVKSMDIDMGDQESFVRDVTYLDNSAQQTSTPFNQRFLNHSQPQKVEEEKDLLASKYNCRLGLSTVFEEEEVDEEDKENSEVEEVKKEVIEEKTVYSSATGPQSPFAVTPDMSRRSSEKAKDSTSARNVRIQNIFTLCGNYRELSQQTSTPLHANRSTEGEDIVSRPENEKLTPHIRNEVSYDSALDMKENCKSFDEDSIEVYVKWEASKGNPGKFVTTLRVVKDASLSDLRKLIEIYLGGDNQAFSFLVLGDPAGAPIQKEKESSIQASRLPICNNQVRGHLACLRPLKGLPEQNNLPLSPLENKLPLTPMPGMMMKQGDSLSPKSTGNPCSTPYITLRRQ